MSSPHGPNPNLPPAGPTYGPAPNVAPNYNAQGHHMRAPAASTRRQVVEVFGDTPLKAPEVDGPPQVKFRAWSGTPKGNTPAQERIHDAREKRQSNYKPYSTELPMHGLNSMPLLYQDMKTGNHPYRNEQAAPARRVAAGLKLGALILATPVLGPLAFAVSVPARRVHEFRLGLRHEPRGIVPQPGEPPRRKK